MAAPLLVVALAGCGSGESGSGAQADETSASGTTATPSIDGRFAVDTGGRKLALRCWGDGSPTVVLDAGTGTPGISEFQDSPIVRALAARIRVCSYDRAGLGLSDPAPLRKRGLNDAADDLHELLQTADVPAPYVLVGSSGGGFDVYQHAGRYPEEVVGLVMLDVPAGQANISPADVPAWDSAENPEHMDYASIERQMALHRLPIPSIPVTVITASQGQSSDPSEQRVWLKGSSSPVQVTLDGGHAIYHDDPDGVLAEIEKVLDSAEVT
jgi:pimeloyl-ACP methyl ester carboxylesterase